MKIVTIFVLIVTTELNAHDYWLRQQSPTVAWLQKISFTDSLNGWAAGDSGIIIHTSNGGLTWVRQTSTIGYTIHDLQFVNPRHGWGIANDYIGPFSTILHTTNGGISWDASFFEDSSMSLVSIYFLDSLTGWISGFGGVFFQTTDGGQNWMPRERDTVNFSGFPVRCFAWWSRFFGFAGGGIYDYGGVVWRSTNSGMFWTTHFVGPEPIFDIYFVDSVFVIGCGGDYEFGGSVIKTFDSGSNWTYETIGLFGVGSSIAFRYLREIWIPLGFSQRWAVSFDSMTTWNEVQGPDSSAIYDALFVDPYHGWGCGSYGLIVKYNPQPIGITNNQNNLPLINILYQNYPNPFNPFTTLKYHLAKPSQVRISIYDALGREIKTILSALQKAGEHNLRFPAEDLSSGVYFYKLQTEDFTESKKMVILK